jgi:PAS domain S-box-containing protein
LSRSLIFYKNSEAQKFNSQAIASIRDFWGLFLQPTISFTAFQRASRLIEVNTQKALSTYKTLLVRYPKQVYIISSYAYFLELVLHNAEEAERYHRRANQLRAREADDTGLSEGGADSQAIISISEEGVIEQVNKTVTTLFGWNRNELIGRNIKILVPSPYKEKHDQFLDRYKSTGNAKVIGQPPRRLFGMHRDGYSFAVNLQVQERRKENGDRAYVGSLIQTDQDASEGVIMINEEGVIQMITKNITKMFGYSAAEVLRTNVTIFMIDAYAANHESYLRRYKETSEAHVIGTSGRNVPARRKDASVFPAALTVEEEYLGNDRFYLGTIQDTTYMSGTIYIDGYGTIQNIDSGITSLLGYAKEDVQGKNIKGIMPPPYNQYHDMYLERYRRTKVSNILRATEGRILPAVHADGSVVQIRAIITRADTGDGGNSSNLLFKGIIRRIDANNKADSGVRAGFDDRDVIEMKKDGTIISLSKTILNTLGFPADKDPEELVGQSIEVIVPPVPQRPRQQKSYWIPQALAAQDLNFYICFLTKNFSLFPMTYCLSMKSSDVILMRVRDVLATDALITIDEVGTVLAMNDDAFLLLGHEPDEIIGQNIKCLLEESVAVQHDGFLLRYKETRVARVVGIPRQISTIHRDKTEFPIEIQVTEMRNGETVTFIGRIRHRTLDEKVDHDLIAGLYVHKKAENENQSLEEKLSSMKSLTGSKGALGSKAGSKLEITGSKAASQMLVDGSQQGEDDFQEEDDDTSSSESEEEEDEDPAAAGIETKLTTIKDSTIEDPSIVSFTKTLNFSFGFVLTLLATALIACNTVRNSSNHFVFVQRLSETGLIFNAILTDARLHYFQQINSRILDKMNASPATQGYLSCSLAENDTRLPMCDFMRKFNGVEKLQEDVKKLLEDQQWLTSNYPTVRTSGDPLDKAVVTNIVVKEYSNGVDAAPVDVTIPTFTDFVTKVLDAIDKIAAEGIDLWDNRAARMDYQFLEANRYLLANIVGTVLSGAFASIKEIIAMEVLVHLILTILMIVGLGASFLLLVPRIRQVQAERLLILKLLLLVPKHLVWDFVYTIYRDAEDEDEENGGMDDFEEDGKTGADAKNAAKAKAMKMRSEEAVEIVNDNVYGLYTFFGLFTASIAVPLIVHVAWRYSFNASWTDKLNNYNDMLSLNINLNALTWRAVGVLAPCEIRPTRDAGFCMTMAFITNQNRITAESTASKYLQVQTNFNGDSAMQHVLYNVDQNVEILPTCHEDNMLKVKIWKPLSNYPQIVYPAGTDTSKDYFMAHAKESRCTDTFQWTNSTPFGLRLPSDYSVRSTHGVGQLVTNTIQSASILGQTLGWNPKDQAKFGPLSIKDVWYNLEAPAVEGVAGMTEVADQIEANLLAEYTMSRTAFNLTYALTIVYAGILYLIVFRSVRQDLSAEFKHNRGILFMVPMQVVAKSKPIIEYIERVFTEITSV